MSANDASVSHYGYDRPEFENLSLRDLQAFDAELPWRDEEARDDGLARTWKHVKADGSLIDVAIYTRSLTYDERPAVLLALIDITERKRAEARLAFHGAA